MKFIQNALQDFKTTIASLAPIAAGGYILYQALKSGNLQQIAVGLGLLGAGGIGAVAKDSGKGN